MKHLFSKHLPWQQLVRYSLRVAAISGLTLGLLGCSNSTNEPTVADSAIPLQTSITVITQPSSHTYFESANGADGFEFRLIESFAKQYNYELNIVLAKNEQDVYTALDQGLADIALIGNPLSFSRQSEYLRSQPLMDITTQLIYKHGSGKPQSFEDLMNKTVVVENTEQYREKYAFLKSHYPDLEWEFSERPTVELLGLVNQGLIDYTLVGSHEFLRKRSLYTKTRVAFDLYYPEPISLVFSEHSQTATRNALDIFFAKASADGTIDSLKERFYGHADDVNPRGSMTFFRRVNTRLPHYKDLIKQVAKDYRINWRLLAAIAYQESHWNPTAKSPTGVRGMMMLTQGTAKDMGIKNRIDTKQSLVGGAKYLKEIQRRLPKDIQEPDRTWFALAAYNVGLGHIRDVRKITEFHGGNPNRWADVKNYLPLLEQKRWHQYTRHGFARGQEPVDYVQHIRHYNDLLEWRFPLEDHEKPATRISVKTLEQQIIKQAKSRQENKAKQA